VNWATSPGNQPKQDTSSEYRTFTFLYRTRTIQYHCFLETDDTGLSRNFAEQTFPKIPLLLVRGFFGVMVVILAEVKTSFNNMQLIQNFIQQRSNIDRIHQCFAEILLNTVQLILCQFYRRRNFD
jgi:hypothetical protein